MSGQQALFCPWRLLPHKLVCQEGIWLDVMRWHYLTIRQSICLLITSGPQTWEHRLPDPYGLQATKCINHPWLIPSTSHTQLHVQITKCIHLLQKWLKNGLPPLMASNKRNPTLKGVLTDTFLALQKFPALFSSKTLCDVKLGFPKSYIPTTLRKHVFQHFTDGLIQANSSSIALYGPIWTLTSEIGFPRVWNTH